MFEKNLKFWSKIAKILIVVTLQTLQLLVQFKTKIQMESYEKSRERLFLLFSRKVIVL